MHWIELPAKRIGSVRLRRPGGVSVVVSLAAILLVLFVLSFVAGRYSISPVDVVKILASRLVHIDQTWSANADTVVMNIRLPRILAAMLVGASLALAGASFQGLFRNPLVSPDTLGVSQGAGFGAALAILLNGGDLAIQASAFCFAILAVAISYSVGRIVRADPILSLILAGMAIGSLFGALLSLMKYVADPVNQLPAITYWLMGSLASVGNRGLLYSAVPMGAGIVVLTLIRWRFNVLAMGEEEAKALGVNTTSLRAMVVLCCTLITASAVCISGTIGWVGLVIPHVGRALVGPNYKALIPVCILLGAVYLLFIDDIARTAISIEIPIGILTAVVGAPFFVYLLSRGGRGWT